MKKRIDMETRSVVFSDDNDSEVGRITYDELVAAEMHVQSALHGASQKIGDSYAGALKATEGLELTAEAWSIQRVKDSIAQLQNGDWNLRTGGAGAAVTDLAIALSEATGATLEEATAKLAGLEGDEGKETKKALRANPKIAAILGRIKSERAAKKAAELDAKAEGKEVDLESFGL